VVAIFQYELLVQSLGAFAFAVALVSEERVEPPGVSLEILEI